jgi:hypothetical protein
MTLTDFAEAIEDIYDSYISDDLSKDQNGTCMVIQRG